MSNLIDRARTKQELVNAIDETRKKYDESESPQFQEGLNVLRKQLNQDVSWNMRDVPLRVGKQRANYNISMMRGTERQEMRKGFVTRNPFSMRLWR